MSVSGSREARIAAIAARQRGRISWRQLLDAGISRTAIRRMVERGTLLARHRGVFAVGHAAPTEYGDETAALLALREGAVLSHHSAARLWDLRTDPDGLIHVTVRGGQVNGPKGVKVHRTTILTPRDIRVHLGLPLTSPARTLLDQAELVTPRRLELAFDQALVSRIMRLGDVDELVERAKGRSGAPALRALSARERGSTTLTRSEAEELFLHLIRAADLPEPAINARIHGYEVDFLWRAPHSLVVEIDGFRYHSTARAFEHDRRKDAVLKTNGLGTLRFTPTALRRHQLMVVARVSQALGRPQAG